MSLETEQTLPVISRAGILLAERIQAINERCFPQAWPLRETRAFLRFTEGGDLRPTIPLEHLALTVIVETRVVGYLLGTLRRDECQVHRLAVLPEHRRQGLATMLLHAFDRRALESRSAGVTIVLRESNLEGQVFFRGVGYRAPAGAIQSGAFADGEAGLVMSKAFVSAHVPVTVRMAE